MSEIADIIKQIAHKKDRVSTFPAVVTNNTIEEVDGKPEYVVTVRKIISDKEYEKAQKIIRGELPNDDGQEKIEMKYVRLKAAINTLDEGMIVVPRKGSWVLVSIIDNIPTKAFVSQYSEIDRILMRVSTPVKEGEQESDDPEYLEINLNAKSIDLLVGKCFKAAIDKEEMVFNYLEPAANEDEEPKVLSEIKSTKDAVDIIVKDKDENEVKKVHIDKADLTITHKEAEQTATHIDPAKLEATVSQAKIALTEEGLEVSNESKNLKETLSKIIDEISKIVVVQGTGPNVGALNALKADIGTILK